MTTTDYGTFQDMGRIFSDLCRRSDKLWRNKKTLDEKDVSNHTYEIYDFLKEKRKMKDTEIEALFKENAHICRLGFNHLYLPPLENDKQFIPILSMKCDLTRSEMSLRIEMVGYNEEYKPMGFGFRFENPHPDSNHNYWHMQVITESLGCPQWLPVQDPCIPIKAKSPIHLILFMLICFYGLRGQKLINDMNLAREYTEPVYDIFS